MRKSDAATVRRDGDALVFSGTLTRDAVASLWKPAVAALDGARRLDLSAVDLVDSAGLALLAELSERAGGAVLQGSPAGLSDLRNAYRLAPGLGFAARDQ
ncbi:STAS domain-containing protein [Luteimonas vadosa]|uniref:STAS domain-containing protein n=1 Tax=Luteimonas vadosa TaxID=1165507 RepID=A0ABP9DQT8_9GAMM